MRLMIFVGTAGWNIPKHIKNKFSRVGSHLERYSRKFNCVEINSSFYRNHKSLVFKKWAASVPDDFRFAVKLSKQVTHIKKLKVTLKELKETITPMFELGDKFAILLVQLPPSLAFELWLVEKFFKNLRRVFDGIVVIEPRHKSWSTLKTLKILKKFDINKVIADPEPCPVPESQRKLVEGVMYYRLHGSPIMYRSKYSKAFMKRILKDIDKKNAWVIFDNTTFGHGTENALEFQGILPKRVISE